MVVWSPFRFTCGREIANRFVIAPLTTDSSHEDGTVTESEIEFVDEQDTDTDIKLVINWTLTLTDFGTDVTERRTSDVDVRLLLKDGKWKIVEFSPLTIFNPQQKPAPKR